MVFFRDFGWEPEMRALAGSFGLASIMAMYFAVPQVMGKLVSGESRLECVTMLCAPTKCSSQNGDFVSQTSLAISP